MRVRTTNESKRRRVRIAELSKVVDRGFVFEVTPERYEVLAGKNRYGAKFVEPVLEENKPSIKEEPIKVEPQEITPVVDEEPEIFVIEPGKEPVKVDKDLKPIEEEEKPEEKPKKRGRKKKEVEVSE